MKTKALLGVLVLVIMPVVIVYLFMQKDHADADNPAAGEALVSVAPRPAPPPDGGPIHGDQVALETAITRSPYSIPVPSLEGVNWQLSGVWVAEDGTPPEFYQAALRYSNGLEILFAGSFGWSSLDDVSNLNISEPFRLTTVNENNARGKDAGVKTLSDGRTRAAYPASLSWRSDNVQIKLYHDTWSMERLKEIAESLPSPTWKPGVQEAVNKRLDEQSTEDAPPDGTPPPAHRPDGN